MSIYSSNPIHHVIEEMIDVVRNSQCLALFFSSAIPAVSAAVLWWSSVHDLAWSGVSGWGHSPLHLSLRNRVILFGLISIVFPWIVYFPFPVHSISLRLICWDWPSAALAEQLFNSVIRYVPPSLTSLHYHIIPPSCCCKSCWLEFSKPHTESLKWDKLKASCMLGLQTERCVSLLAVFCSLNELVSHHRHAGLIRQHVWLQRMLRGDGHPGTGGVINVLRGRRSVWPEEAISVRLAWALITEGLG